MTSRQPLIPGESEEALKAHLDHWNALYPEVETDELLSDLVREAAFSHWLLLRSQRQYDFTLALLHKTQIDDWTPEQNHTFQLRERGGHPRKWPDLRADDEHIIQMKIP